MLMHCQRDLEYERHMKRPVEGDLSVAQAVLYRGSSWAFFAMTVRDIHGVEQVRP
jgi:hypothetical protein